MRSVLIILLIFSTSCRDGRHQPKSRNTDNLKVSQDGAVLTTNDLEVDCDSIFREKGYKTALKSIRNGASDESSRIFAFKFLRNKNGHTYEVFTDTIESSTQEIKFTDFNGDKTRDILIQNYSDARSNWTYYLFLVGDRLDTLKRIRGFEEIKNPRYLPALDVVTNYVNSGKNWTRFYKIQADSVIDLDIEIEDDLRGDDSYKRNYDRAISELARRMKNTSNKP